MFSLSVIIAGLDFTRSFISPIRCCGIKYNCNCNMLVVGTRLFKF